MGTSLKHTAILEKLACQLASVFVARHRGPGQVLNPRLWGSEMRYATINRHKFLYLHVRSLMCCQSRRLIR